MIYATRNKDAWQHLITASDGPALCGATGPWNARNGVLANPVPGVPLCTECKGERARRNADADMEARRINAKTFWLQERTP